MLNEVVEGDCKTASRAFGTVGMGQMFSSHLTNPMVAVFSGTLHLSMSNLMLVMEVGSGDFCIKGI